MNRSFFIFILSLISAAQAQMDTVIQLNSFARSEVVDIWANDTTSYVLVNTNNAVELPSGFTNWKGQSDILLIAYDSNQVYRRHWEFGGFYSDFGHHLTFHNEQLYISGSFDRQIQIGDSLYQNTLGRCGLVIGLDLYNYDLSPFILEAKNAEIKDLTFYHDQAVVVGGFYDTIVFGNDTIDGGVGKDLFIASYDWGFSQVNWYDYSEGNATELNVVDRTLSGICAVGSYSDGVVLDGQTLSNANTNHNLLIVKYNDLGALEWYKTFESNAELHGKSLACGPDELLVGAEYEGDVFDGSQMIAQAGVGYDGLVVVLDDDGILKDQITFEGQGNEIINDIQYIDESDYILIAQTGINTFIQGELYENNGFNESMILQYNSINKQTQEIGRVKAEAPAGVVLGTNIFFDGRKVYQGGENLTRIDNGGQIYEASNFGEGYWSVLEWTYESLFNSIVDQDAEAIVKVSEREVYVQCEGLTAVYIYDMNGRLLSKAENVLNQELKIAGEFPRMLIIKLSTQESVIMLKTLRN